MYIPGCIAASYTLWSVIKHEGPIGKELIPYVIFNVGMAEIVYLMCCCWIVVDQCVSIQYTLLQLVAMELVQETYTWFIHRMFHHPMFYRWHKLHHTANAYGGAYAWLSHPIDHLVITLGSIVFAAWIIPVCSWVFTVVVLYGTYSSIDGHMLGSQHHVHHLQHNRRYGVSFLLIDRLMGTY